MKRLSDRLDRAIRRITLLLLPVLLAQSWGCQESDHFANWDPGPEVTAEDIDRAIADPALAGDPYTIELGQGVVFSDTQELIGIGAPPYVSADTVRTIVELNDLPEEAPEVRYLTMIENRFLYSGNETKQVSTEIPLQLELQSADPQTIGVANQQTDSSDRIGTNLNPLGHGQVSIQTRLRPHSLAALKAIAGVQNTKELSNILKSLGGTSEKDLSTQNERVTYHKLRVDWEDRVPPQAVLQQDQCGSVPGCRLKTAVISFDMVFWSGDVPDRMHWRFAISPDAPFLAQILDRCVTSLVEVGEGASSYLIKQCQPVVNFRYRAL